MRTHQHTRLSASAQLVLIEEALDMDIALLEHCKNCVECSDDSEVGTCPVADAMFEKIKEFSKKLKRFGIPSGLGDEQ